MSIKSRRLTLTFTALMRTAIAIFLLSLLLAIQTPVGQLIKFPLLIEHFMKHQQKDGVSLVDFLKNHYDSNHNDADKPEDEQLPFKSVYYYAIGHAIVPGLVQAVSFNELPADRKVQLADNYVLQQHLADIFRPPRA